MDVSVIIRARNEQDHIGRTIEAVRDQQFDGDVEIIVVDSESSDNTARIARANGCRVIAISLEQFTWGRALNVGARHARGTILVNLSAHAQPADRMWLERLTAPLRTTGNRIVGVFGRQLPVRGGDPFEAVELRLWFPSGEEPIESRWFSNANGAYLRAVWERRPFDESLMIQEDCVWSTSLAKEGYCTLYEPRAQVFHNHELSISPRDALNGIFGRWYWRSYTRFLVVDDYRGDSIRYALSSFRKFARLDLLHLWESGQVFQILRIPVYEFVRQYASWLGARHHRSGSRFRQPRWRDRYLAPKLPALLGIVSRVL